MASAFQLLVFSLLMLTLPGLASSCRKRRKPLLLTPYLHRNEVKKARGRSRVQPDCLASFVPTSHTGYITVDDEMGNHLFFWFFPLAKNKQAPLVLWLNGGPTVSSMLGLFWENGPMEVLRRNVSETNCNGQRERSKGGYKKRQYSWTNSFAMLYVDSPVGVGFSFSDNGEKGYRFTAEGYSRDMTSFIRQFFRIFPEYKTRPFYIGGQSYDARHISAFAYDTHVQMQLSRLDFNLSGIFFGAPYYDPETQNEVFYDYLYAMGVISHDSRLKAKEECRKLYSEAKRGALNEFDLFGFSFSTATFDTGGSLDNIVTREAAGYDEIASLLSKDIMKRAAHVGNKEFAGNMRNQDLALRFTQAMLVSTKTKMAELMDNYKVLIYNGNYDAAVSTPMIEAALHTTPWAFQKQYNESKQSAWTLNSEQVGYFSLTDKLCRVVVHGAGHQVPHEKPEVSYAMIHQFITDGCVSNVYSDTLKVAVSKSSSIALKTSLIFVVIIRTILEIKFSLIFP